MKFQIQNDCTVRTNAELMLDTAGCAAQLREDVAPTWERLAPVVEFSDNGAVDADAYQVQVKDDADSPGELGFHDVDDQGKPIVFIFAKTALADGQTVSSVLSHELCEAFADPSCTLWHQCPDGKMRALELCDAVENDSYSKQIGDTMVTVSNFVTPNYFRDTPIPGEKFDFMGKLSGPAPARTPGGYDIVIETNGAPSQEFSEHFREMARERPHRAAMKSSPYSRTARRMARS
jgi:hypothetical protein